MHELETLGIEFKPESKYTTACPKCSGERRKKNTKSLTVFVELPYIRFQCFHPSCEWATAKQQFIKVGDMENNLTIKEVKHDYTIIKDPKERPPVDSDTILYKYCNKQKEILYYIARKQNQGQKEIRPWAKTVDGKWVMERPSDKTLYRSEYLTQSNPVLIVEGEKTADAAAKLLGEKIDVVSWVGGAKNYKQGDWELLKGRKIILWPDNDKEGIDAMKSIAGLIESDFIHLVDTTGLPDKSDLADDISIDIVRERYAAALKTNIACPVVKGLIGSDHVRTAFETLPQGLPFGWTSVDKYIQLPPCGVVLIPGRTNHGKSAFMINIMANLLAQTAVTVVYLSYEMSYKEILLRLTKTIDGTRYSAVGYEDDKIYHEMIQAKQSKAYTMVEKYIADKRLLLTDHDVSIDEVLTLMKRLHDKGQKAVIFVDYVQLIPTKGGKDQRYLEVKNVAEKLRQAANNYEQIVIEGSQLTNGETPFADSARESKDLEFTAALILKIWNKKSAEVTGTYKTKKVDGEEAIVPYYDHVYGDFVVEVRKTRQGEVGRCFGFNWTNGCKLLPALEDPKVQTKF